jgi:hypothetical protein
LEVHVTFSNASYHSRSLSNPVIGQIFSGVALISIDF